MFSQSTSTCHAVPLVSTEFQPETTAGMRLPVLGEEPLCVRAPGPFASLWHHTKVPSLALRGCQVKTTAWFSCVYEQECDWGWMPGTSWAQKEGSWVVICRSKSSALSRPGKQVWEAHLLLQVRIHTPPGAISSAPKVQLKHIILILLRAKATWSKLGFSTLSKGWIGQVL